MVQPCWLVGAAAFCGEVEIYPTVDREIPYTFATQEYMMVADGQFSPTVEYSSSPYYEDRLVIKFDLSSYHDIKLGKIIFKFFVRWATNISSLRVDAWYFGASSDVNIEEGDYNRGDTLVGKYSWDGTSSSSTTIEEWAEMDVTDIVNNRTGNYVYFNLRLSGEYPGYDGNVFDPNTAHHYTGIAAEKFNGIQPRLVISSPFVLTGKDRTVCGSITLDGSGSYDPDPDLISHQWKLKCRGNPLFDRQVNGATGAVDNLRPGFYDVELTVENGDHDTATGGFVAVCLPGRPGDFNSDGDVDGTDLASFADEFGESN